MIVRTKVWATCNRANIILFVYWILVKVARPCLGCTRWADKYTPSYNYKLRWPPWPLSSSAYSMNTYATVSASNLSVYFGCQAIANKYTMHKLLIYRWGSVQCKGQGNPQCFLVQQWDKHQPRTQTPLESLGTRLNKHMYVCNQYRRFTTPCNSKVKSVKCRTTITELVVVWSLCNVCTSVAKSKVVTL